MNEMEKKRKRDQEVGKREGVPPRRGGLVPPESEGRLKKYAMTRYATNRLICIVAVLGIVVQPYVAVAARLRGRAARAAHHAGVPADGCCVHTVTHTHNNVPFTGPLAFEPVRRGDRCVAGHRAAAAAAAAASYGAEFAPAACGHVQCTLRRHAGDNVACPGAAGAPAIRRLAAAAPNTAIGLLEAGIDFGIEADPGFVEAAPGAIATHRRRLLFPGLNMRE